MRQDVNLSVILFHALWISWIRVELHKKTTLIIGRNDIIVPVPKNILFTNEKVVL